MPEFRFAFPAAFLVVIPAILIYLWQRRHARMLPGVRYSDTRLLTGLSAGLRQRLRRIPDILLLTGTLALIIALAQPQAGTATETIQGRGIDIVIALDISDSMSADDFEPNRLSAAKRVIAQFISQRQVDRIGLVVFAERAFYQSPPTLDYNVLLQLVDQVPFAFQLGMGDRTAVGEGIATAANLLRDSGASSKIIIILTDGENNAGRVDPITAAEAARVLGIRVYVIGVGLLGPRGSEGQATLQRVANIGDGRYFSALQTEDLNDIYREIDRLERSPIEQTFAIRWDDQAHIFILIGLILLLIERILRHTIFQTLP